MFLDALSHKLQFLRDADSRVIHAADSAAAALARSHGLSASVTESIALTLAYAIERHAQWLDAPLFQDVLANHLTIDYRLERRHADQRLAEVISVARPLVRPSHIAATDAEFLRFVFVQLTAAADEAALVRDLGVGTALLHRISASIEPSGATYVPEIDHHIETIMAELARALEALPDATDVLRLSYQLIGIDAPWCEMLRQDGARWVFEFLVAIGAKKTMTLKQAILVFDQAAELLSALQKYDLVFPAGAGKWELTPRALELTATAFAIDYAKTRGSEALDGLAELAPAYQAQVIRHLALDAASLKLLATSKRPLAPAALAATLARYTEVAGETAGKALAEQIAALEPSLWLRRVAERQAQT